MMKNLENTNNVARSDYWQWLITTITNNRKRANESRIQSKYVGFF